MLQLHVLSFRVHLNNKTHVCLMNVFNAFLKILLFKGFFPLILFGKHFKLI